VFSSCQAEQAEQAASRFVLVCSPWALSFL